MLMATFTKENWGTWHVKKFGKHHAPGPTLKRKKEKKEGKKKGRENRISTYC